MKKEEIKEILKQDFGKRIMLDLEIEQNELAYINYYLSVAEYIDTLDIPVDIKRKEIKSALKMVKTAAKVIANKMDEVFESDKFNGK